MNNSYDLGLRQLAKDVAKEIGISDYIREGVYVMLGGPAYETVAELRLLRMLGVDAVGKCIFLLKIKINLFKTFCANQQLLLLTGMSTVPEVIVARHCGMTVFAFSLITNECITEYDCDREANHEEVIETANKRQNDLKLLVTRMVATMSVETVKPVKNGH